MIKIEINRYIINIILFFSLSIKIWAIDTEQAGDILQIMIPTSAFLTTFILKDEVGQIEFYKSFFTNLTVTYALKYSIKKKRPNGGWHSFPSGHTSASFQGASFIHKRYGLNYAILPYISAIFVGYSRVYAKAHYTNDVIAGAIIGSLSSFYFTTKYKGFEIRPIVFNSGYGVNITTTW